MPAAAWAWAAQCLKFSSAIATAALSSSSVYWIARRVLVLGRGHRAGRHHLDQVGAVGELLAGRRAHLLGPVGDLVHAGIVLPVDVVIDSSRPAQNRRGPEIRPALIAFLTAIS